MNFKIQVDCHYQLNTDERVSQFLEFLQKEYPSYIDDENVLFAHDESDFDWFVAEFVKSRPNYGKPDKEF